MDDTKCKLAGVALCRSCLEDLYNRIEDLESTMDDLCQDLEYGGSRRRLISVPIDDTKASSGDGLEDLGSQPDPSEDDKYNYKYNSLGGVDGEELARVWHTGESL